MKHKSKFLLLTTLVFTMSGCSIINNILNPSKSDNNSSNQTSSSDSQSGSSFTPTSDTFNPENNDAQSKTIKQMLDSNSKNNNNTTLYRIRGTVQWISNTRYGNFDLVDSTGYVYVYGCSKNNTSMNKNGSTYSFSNDQTFSTADIKPGDELVMEGIYQWYAVSSSYGYPEFLGYAISIVRKGLSEIPNVSYSSPDTYSGSYYNSVEGQTGATLKTSLHNLMDSTHSNYVSYSSLDSHFKSSDASGSKIKCFYSGQATNSYNKEHVWCQSLSGESSSNRLYGEDHGGSDIHHIRPTIGSYNSLRSNAAFGTVFGEKSGMKSISYSGGGADYLTGNVFEPADAIKGDVARIVMYMYIHYSSEVGGTQRSYYGKMSIYKIMAPYGDSNGFKLLRKWNAEDPVSQEEITRNNYAYSVQGNRNPFIDHPSYADLIWG